MNNIDFKKYQIKSVINIPIQLYFINQIEEINAILGQQQVENIVNTIKLINLNEKKSEKIENMKNQNIQKCINWCIQNKIPYNKFIQPTNIFMRKS